MRSSDNSKNALMHFNRLTLSFSGIHADLEPHFQEHYLHSTLNQNRMMVFAAFIFYAVFAILDAIVIPELHLKFWLIRWAIVCPCLLLVLLSSYNRQTARHFQVMVSLGTLIAGFGIIAMLHMSAPYQNNAYEGGLVQVIFFIFTFGRLRFIWGSGAACTLVLSYLISFIIAGTLLDNYLIGKGFHLSLICLMGMMAGYTIEYQTRKNFFLSHQLESKKRRLAVANEFLEQRVADRTSELRRTNVLLKEEINERKIMESALRDSQKRFQNIFETGAAGMAIVDGQTQQVEEINTVAAQMMGRIPDQIIGQKLDTLITMPEKSTISHLPVPTRHPVECLLSMSQDLSLPILASSRTTLFDDRQHWIISFVSTLEIKEAEAEKRELEQRATRMMHLESIGTLAGGIAHDFNNILFGIMGFAELSLEDAEEKSPQARNLKEIIRGGHRAKEMISQILTFSRQDSVEKRIIDPALIIKEAIKLIRATFPSTIDIKSHFAADLHRIKANPTHIHQVVMNLCTNAAHALGDSVGRIEIRLGNVCLASDLPTPHGKLPEGDYFQIIVKDNGEGIPQEVINRIFDPYFTTKAQGEGSGMGLSVVLGIVQALDGNIRVDSHPGQGTEFELLFPASHEAVQDTEVNDVPLSKGSEHIMVIDDEHPLLVMFKRMLTGLGYRVTICEHAIEALTLFKGQADAYDLVITDLTMPKMTGIQLSRELLQIRPDLPIILCTGYNKKLSRTHLQSMGIRELLPKPILKKELASSIRRAVEAN